MTDVVDADAGVPSPAGSPVDDGPAGTAGGGHPGLAALVAGAGVIHLAMVPSHLDASTVDGVGFFVAGWLQLGLAALLAVRGGARALRAAVVVDLALIAAWAVSRTAGLPVGAHAGEAEDASLVDGLCVALEVAAVVVAATLLLRPALRARRAPTMALAGGLVALVLVTAALASPSARDHGNAGHGDAGHGAEDDLGFAALQNGQMGDHEHAEGEAAGAGDGPPAAAELAPEEAGELAGQLARTASLVEKYPTIAEAREAGYRQAGPFSPGLGTHYSRFSEGTGNPDGVMDAADIAEPILIFDGLDDDARLAGFMYMAYQETEPEGFAGPLDRWHYHTSVCMVQTPDGIETPFGADLTGVTEEMCNDVGGELLEFTGYMVHVWTVPGYESELGTFSDLNPRLTCPDGTYHAVPVSEAAGRDSLCENP